MLRLAFFSIVLFSLIVLITINFEHIILNIIQQPIYINHHYNPYYHLFYGLIVFLMLTYLITRTHKKVFIYSWLVKVLFSVVIGGYFEFINSNLDQYYYYQESIIHLNQFNISYGTPFIISFNQIVSFIIGDSFYALKACYTFISFLGLILLYKSYLIIISDSEKYLNSNYEYLIFLLPSVLLWTSLIGKDSLILFAISLFIYSLISFINLNQKRYIFYILLSLVLSFYIRPWMVFILMATVISFYFIYLKFKYKILLLTLLISCLVIVEAILPLSLTHIFENKSFFKTLGEIQQSFSRGNTAQELYLITSFWDYIKYYIPNLFTTLFMPFPFLGTNSIFMWFFSIESLLLFIGTVLYVVLNIKYVISNKYLVFLLLFIFFWSLIYVILSPGNLGTALRYKTQVLPILVIIILVSKSYLDLKKEKYKCVE